MNIVTATLCPQILGSKGMRQGEIVTPKFLDKLKMWAEHVEIQAKCAKCLSRKGSEIRPEKIYILYKLKWSHTVCLWSR